MILICPYLLGTDWGSEYKGDLILKNRSDYSVKFLTPPLSIVVINNQPKKGPFYFFRDGKNQSEKIKSSINNHETIWSILNDPKLIKDTLMKTDPTRLTPSKKGSNHKGPVTKPILRALSNEQHGDLLFIFRWILEDESDSNIESIGKPGYLFTLTASGLVYISKQNKVLALPDVIKKGEDLKKMAYYGLEMLASNAKKIIQAQKKIVTKSY